MNIRYFLPNLSCRQTVKGSRAFLLTGSEGWFSLWSTRQTRYEGWYVTEENTRGFLKLLERVTYRGSEPSGITSTDDATIWDYADGERLGFRLTNDARGLAISSLRELPITLTLDVRGIYEFPSSERHYTLEQDATGFLITYIDGHSGTTRYLHLRGSGLHEAGDAWRQVSYPRDESRNSPPAELYVYEAITLHTDHIGIGYGNSAEEAREQSSAAYDLSIPSVGIGISTISTPLRLQTEIAQRTTERALAALTVPAGIYAGLPWFHQVWTRDELITALGLPPEVQLAIIERYCTQPLQNGELGTFIGSGTTCSDGVGWLALLVKEFGLSRLPRNTRAHYRDFLKEAYRQLKERQAHHGLIPSGYNATWMDTIGREGYPIEIQAMFALVLEQLAILAKDPSIEQERLRFLSTIREHYVQDLVLFDGLDDPTIRPNSFIVYLLQPDLLQEHGWQHTFRRVIEGCWLSWGGFSSIDRQDSRFQPLSTGQNNLSYHNGDSWFFINNLAAVAMHRFSVGRYREYILGILQSSTNEILWKHMLGQPGEIASAETGESWGCGCQAFAGGTYLLLLEELSGYWSQQKN